MKKKTFVFDLDGTLLNDDGTISNDVIDIIKEISREKQIIYATGRSYVGLPRSLEPIMSYASYIITSNGTSIIKRNGEICYTDWISNDIATSFLKQIENGQLFAEILINGKWHIDEKMILNASKIGLSTELINYISKTRITHNDLFEFLQKGKESIEKITVNLPIENRLAEKCTIGLTAEKMNLKCWTDKAHKIDIYNADTSKGKALQYLDSVGKIELSNTICFGNDVNDLEMFRACRISICMPEAIDEVKRVASYALKKTTTNRIIDAFDILKVNAIIE